MDKIIAVFLLGITTLFIAGCGGGSSSSSSTGTTGSCSTGSECTPSSLSAVPANE